MISTNWEDSSIIKRKLTSANFTKKIKKSGLPVLYDNNKLYIDNRTNNTLIIGASGSGKTQTIILPQLELIRLAFENAIVHDTTSKIYEMTKGNAIMVTEVGQHQMWAAQYYKYSKPRTLLTSGGLGTMGYGLGAAIGAQTANPDRTVVNIAGDGCFRMNMNELATASREKLPLIEVIINNHVLGMVRQWQTLFYEKHYSATVLDDGVDYVKLSEAMGATARRVKTQEEFEKAFADALKSKTPFVIDCIIDSDDKVWPMVAPGKPINESFDEEDYNATQGGN